MTAVTFTVNGTEVALDVEPRLTLADALRHRLGLTGTHLGCEHGVCGACTVLVDGAAVRSCLLFCVQAAGAEVTTVEGLGDVDDLHPLQEAFRRHHGLQCGFCTPGFLMSAYELLRDGGDWRDDRHLRRELSGVLCRCTGYDGIVAAVAEVAAAHPRGLPPPKALGRPITVRGAMLAPGEGHALEARRPEPAAPALPARLDLTVPEGPPTETVEVTTTIAPPVEDAWALLSDLGRASRCMPGVELERADREDAYSGHVRVHLGPMRLDFAGAARLLERDHERRAVRVIAAGRDPSGSGVRADVVLGAKASERGGTVVRATAKLHLSGRAAQFGRSIAGDVSRQLFNEFGACVERTLTTGDAEVPRRLAGGALAWRVLRARALALLRRLLGRGKRDQ
jgi:carbon-monoxide dehydrogenase small subunit